ncbi:MAG: glycosyltransferase [Candidatus Marinimicrobia bacterium]|nr:glycosyltransferase [Candidatus Neomarinimicrobiota bacterium]
MKKVLIITYYWPPAGGPGVQRVLKFAKYLHEFGWMPLILSVQNGEYPALDSTFANEIPAGIKVYQTKTRNPITFYKKFTGENKESIPIGILAQKKLSFKKRIANFVRLNLVIPDAKIGWMPYAVKEGNKIINEHKPEMIFSSSPPPTVHLIAKKLSRHNNIKWVADLRDPWSQIYYYKNNRSGIAARIDASLERKTLASADAVTTVSKHFKELIISEKRKTTIIPNGFDKSDFGEGNFQKTKNERFTIAYVGGLNENRFYPLFFQGLKNFALQNNIKKEKILLILAGQIQTEYLEKIRNILEDSVAVDYNGYITHPEAIHIMSRSDLLVLFMEKASNYSGHIPGKVFEYLITGNYILGIGSKNSDVGKILTERDSGIILDQEDDLSGTFFKLYNTWKSGNLSGADPRTLKEYSRRNLTKQLSELFDSL